MRYTPYRYSHIPLVLFLLITINGCSTTHGNWGSATTFSPGWQVIQTSAVNAARDPHTWVPLIGALTFGIDDYDQQTANWATRHNPLFGNIEDAEDASDQLKQLSELSYFVSALLISSGQGKEGALNKTKGVGMGLLAIGVNRSITDGVKSATDRKRPGRTNENDKDNSFPSGHTSIAATAAKLAVRNIEQLELTDNKKRFWQWSSYAAAGLTGWARVEGQRHYPSDVLAGYALGSFLGAFFNDAFITPDQQDDTYISVSVDSTDKLIFSITHQW